MIDTHCHLDLYPDPSATARAALKAGVAIIAVTNLPSAYQRALPFVNDVARLRLALGLHPLMADQHPSEWGPFKELARDAFYIGEIGLDFSPQGISTKELQVRSFRFVLEALAGNPKFITLHSRRAESTVLELLREARRAPVVFHWYTGPLNVLREALEDGHYFSINPAMTTSPHGRRVIESIPEDRILTETDGPFVQIGGRAAVPADIEQVEKQLAAVWHRTPNQARQIVAGNFRAILKSLRSVPELPGGTGHPDPAA